MSLVEELSRIRLGDKVIMGAGAVFVVETFVLVMKEVDLTADLVIVLYNVSMRDGVGTILSFTLALVLVLDEDATNGIMAVVVIDRVSALAFLDFVTVSANSSRYSNSSLVK